MKLLIVLSCAAAALALPAANPLAKPAPAPIPQEGLFVTSMMYFRVRRTHVYTLQPLEVPMEPAAEAEAGANRPDPTPEAKLVVERAVVVVEGGETEPSTEGGETEPSTRRGWQ